MGDKLPFYPEDPIHNNMKNKIETRKKRKEGPDSKTSAEITALQNAKDIANIRKQKHMFEQTEILHDNQAKVKLELERIEEEKKKIEKEELERIEEEKKK